MNPKELYARLNPLLRPLAPPYAALMKARRGLYAAGILPSYKPSCPCIAVGNIAFGGTGKSPLVGWLLEKARQEGKRAVVLSRGYGGKPGPAPLEVRPDTPVRLCGDEPLMLAQSCPWATILVHPRRSLSARLAEERLAPDWLILDDGMQHLAVDRALNLVLLRPGDLRGDWGRVVPSGPWREGPSALASASAFLLRCPEEAWPGLLPDLHARLDVFDRPVFSFDLEPRGLRALGDAPGGSSPPPGGISPTSGAPHDARAQGGAGFARDLGGAPYILLSGVAGPGDVEAAAARLLGPALRHFAFADHRAFGPREAREVNRNFALSVPLVCTAKDAVKLEGNADFAGRPLWVLEADVRFGPALFSGRYSSAQGFPGWLDGRLQALRPQIS